MPAEGMTFLCRVDEVTDPGAKGVVLDKRDANRNFVVVKRDGEIFAYINSCPHWGTPLEIVPGNLMTRDKKHLFCATHGAQFRLDDGYCVDGPCEGDTLTPVVIAIEDGAVMLDEERSPKFPKFPDLPGQR